MEEKLGIGVVFHRKYSKLSIPVITSNEVGLVRTWLN
jgi:hypothetical protein